MASSSTGATSTGATSSGTSTETTLLPPFKILRRDDPKQLALIVGGSVLVFLLTFASAHAWVLSAKWLITKNKFRYYTLILAVGFTVLTFLAAYGFAAASQHEHVRLPLDASGVLSNVGLDIQEKRDQEDAQDAAKLRAALTHALRDALQQQHPPPPPHSSAHNKMQ